MIDRLCNFLIRRMQKEMPDIDEERAEVIKFGLQNIIGEIPKLFLLVTIAFVLGVGELTLLAYLLILPFRSSSGGFHLKTHLGCIVGTTLFFCGTAFLSKYLILDTVVKYVLTILTWIFGMAMSKKYAPADTENIPILDSKTRTKKRRMAYVTLTLSLIASVIIPNPVISNILLYGMILQSVSITKVAYRLTKNKYGYEVEQEANIVTA